ncbi:tetratricopeptide repeat protein [Novosphingobium sp. Gsoil 351]|uniref:tetratricopeptide repeat protein n=1 Tax=Novosphingobium sp. Gsoil 351 TaxID=2675225 RepID=UPI0018A852D7|nr:tetratricopeptide repeat protein [Novosphingobium sp. Gsoil 351]
MTEAPVAVAAPARSPAAPTVEDDRLQLCIERAGQDPATALAEASAWVAAAKGANRSKPLECLGQIYTVLLRWDAAESAFAEAAGVTPSSDDARRSALFAQAGNAALAGGHADRALSHLDAALGVPGIGPLARGQAEIDRARALVALGRLDDAVAAFASAQRDTPDDPDAWLLGATLARRRGDYAAAQRQIEVAGKLAATDPEVGLEAGVIAMLDGREPAARKAWQSVALVAPGTKAAETAKGYLAQLGDAPAPTNPPTSPRPVEGR